MSDEKKTDEKTTATTPEEQVVTTQHTLKMPSGTIAYTATAGTYLLREEDEEGGHKPKASIFYTAYTKNDADAAKRPITFAFNGGPGSSSVWLHLGTFGPRRVVMDDMGNALPPPYKLEDNEYSLLDITDLVFIDPVSTGYSRAVPGEKAKEYHGFEKDIESVAEFIRMYASRNGRWLSPKFLAGESYGTTRAAALSGKLQNDHGMFLNGILLISAILQFQGGDFHTGNDLPNILFLPTYAATAWYHGRLRDDEYKQPDEKYKKLGNKYRELGDEYKKLADEYEAAFRQLREDVEEFASGEYAAALFKGRKLSVQRRKNVVEQLVRFTGLSAEYIESTNLRIEHLRFCKELLRKKRFTVGRLDSRFTGIDLDSAGQYFEHDPSYTNILGCYTATFNQYVRGELKYKSDLPYEILTGKVRPWNYKPFENAYLNVAETLRGAISRNPHLRVFVASGFYDLATPYFATEYTLDHLHLDSSLQEDNIDTAYYEAGHMMYVHQPSLEKLKVDIAAFVEKTLG